MKGFTQPALIDSYNSERVPIVSTMLNMTTTMWNSGISGGLANAMGDLANHPEFTQLALIIETATWFWTMKSTKKPRAYHRTEEIRMGRSMSETGHPMLLL